MPKQDSVSQGYVIELRDMRGDKCQCPVTRYMGRCMFTKTLLLLSRLVSYSIDQKVVMCMKLKLSNLKSRVSKFNFPRPCCALGSRITCRFS